MLKGRVRLDLKRGREVIAREEGENTITPWFSTAINKGNWNYLMNNSKILPLDQWFAGCLLTDKQAQAYNKVRPHFYTHNMDCPPTSDIIITDTPELEPYY